MAVQARSKLATYMDTTPSSTATYSLLGSGVSEAGVDYSPKTTTEQYISQDTATTTLTGYEPKMAVKQTVDPSDSCYTFIDTLRVNRAVMAASQTTIVNVDLYKTATGGAYPAEKQTVSVSIDKYGGAGGDNLAIEYTLNYVGDPVKGTFNPTTKTFTAS